MADEGHVPDPPAARTLLWQVLGALGAAVVILTLFVLPAEYGIDPTGFGRLTGLAKLAAPREVKVEAKAGAATPLHRPDATPWRTDTIDIPLTPEDAGSELEWKVRMKPGATMVYSWTVSGITNPEEFYYDLHSQSDPTPKIQVMSHEAKTGLKGSGALTAPFAGIHGWYLQNQSVSKAVVHLKLAGFYELVSAREMQAAGEAYAAQASFGPAKSP